jgi:hypothetical protein
MRTINLNVSLKCESNASALLPARKSSKGVQSPRLIRKYESRHRLRKQLATGFELFVARQYLQCPCLSPGEILMQDDIAALFAYDRWANTKILDACRQLTAEQYVAEPVPGWSSVRSTIFHIVLVTEFHLRTLAGDPEDSVPTEAGLATVDNAARMLERAYRRFEELRPTLTPERLNAMLTVRGGGYTFTLPGGRVAPHCQSLHLPPQPGRLQAETVRDRTTMHRLLLLGDRAGSPRGINRNRVRHGIRPLPRRLKFRSCSTPTSIAFWKPRSGRFRRSATFLTDSCGPRRGLTCCCNRIGGRS